MVSQSGMWGSPLTWSVMQRFGERRAGSPRPDQVGPKLLCGRVGHDLEEAERPAVRVLWQRGAARSRLLSGGVWVPDVMGGVDDAVARRDAFGVGFDETSVGVAVPGAAQRLVENSENSAQLRRGDVSGGLPGRFVLVVGLVVGFVVDPRSEFRRGVPQRVVGGMGRSWSVIGGYSSGSVDWLGEGSVGWAGAAWGSTSGGLRGAATHAQHPSPARAAAVVFNETELTGLGAHVGHGRWIARR